jgi:quercetin dioxygenase-like cupin family protein
LKPSRRDLVYLLPAVAASQEKKQPAPKPKLASKVYVYEEMAVRQNGPNNQNRQRAVLNGLLHGGFPLECHLTELAPGQAPHGEHRHVHEEMVCLQTGQLDVTIEGKTTRLTAGSVAIVASNEMHGWKNPSSTERAQYFVIALGQGQA